MSGVTVDNAEKDILLTTRKDGNGKEKPDLRGLKERFEKARLSAPPRGTHCRDCWEKGRNFALKELESTE